MSMSLKNPDTRAIPTGWAEHYDSERRIWYYVDLNAESPRVSFAHPCDLDRRHPSSAPARVKEHPTTTATSTARDSILRPAGPRKSSSASVNAIIRESQRSRRATVAQQLYASALSVAAASGSGSTRSSSSSRTSSTESSRRPSVCNTSPESDEVASNSAKGPTVSTTSPPSLPPQLGTHHPRKFFDCTRLAPATRRMTINGPRPSPTPLFSSDPDRQTYSDSASFGNAQAFYHPSVSQKTSTSPVPPHISPHDPPETHRGAPAKVLPKKPTITIPSSGPSLIAIKSPSGKVPERMLYNGTTEDNLIIIPKPGTRAPLSASPVPLNVSALQENSQPAPANSSRPIRTASPPPSVTILQPKPIRPMQGITLNLQVQVSGVSELDPNQSGSNKSGKRKSQLLKNFGLGKAGSKGKQRLIEPEESELSTTGVDALPSNLDGSFVLVETMDHL